MRVGQRVRYCAAQSCTGGVWVIRSMGWKFCPTAPRRSVVYHPSWSEFGRAVWRRSSDVVRQDRGRRLSGAVVLWRVAANSASPSGRRSVVLARVGARAAAHPGLGRPPAHVERGAAAHVQGVPARAVPGAADVPQGSTSPARRHLALHDRAQRPIRQQEGARIEQLQGGRRGARPVRRRLGAALALRGRARPRRRAPGPRLTQLGAAIPRGQRPIGRCGGRPARQLRPGAAALLRSRVEVLWRHRRASALAKVGRAAAAH